MVTPATPPSRNLASLCLDHAGSDHPAIIDLSAEPPMTLSYAQLAQHAAQLSRQLLELGLKPQDRVAILGDNSAAFVAAYLGILRVGLVAVPLNHRLPGTMIAHIIQDSGARLVLHDAGRQPQVPEGIATMVLPNLQTPPSGAADQAAGGWPPMVFPESGEPALFLYTSGSTGRPKGVVISHDAYLWSTVQRLQAANYREHRFLVAAPLYHMNALNTVQLALGGGATVVLLPRFQARTYQQALRDYQCTWLTAIPTMIAMLEQDGDGAGQEVFTHVRMLRLGSEPLPRHVVERARRLFPNASISNGYGTTETGGVVFGRHPAGLEQPWNAIGCRIPGVSIRLVSAGNQDADEGVLQVRSPALMNGYHNLPQATRASMTDDGYYITGDVLQRDEHGFYYVVGRADDMFACGGENIFPGAVQVLLEKHPDVRQACVVPVPDPIKGAKPVALVTLRPGAQADAQALRDYTLANGPAYQHPRQIFIVDALPVGSTQKIDRQAALVLARQWAATSTTLNPDQDNL